MRFAGARSKNPGVAGNPAVGIEGLPCTGALAAETSALDEGHGPSRRKDLAAEAWM